MQRGPLHAGIGGRLIPNWQVRLVYRTDRYGRGGDHVAFNELGFPALRVTEANENYTRQHQDVRIENGVHYGDVLNGVDLPYLAKVAGMNAITLASMAWAPAPPAGVDIHGAVTPDTTLNWKTPQGKIADDVAGYRVYWRLTTEPAWTHSRYIDKASRYILQDVSIDDCFFGVSSLPKDGFASPVVFPGATGAF